MDGGLRMRSGVTRDLERIGGLGTRGGVTWDL
jgi:hypothetical protein